MPHRVAEVPSVFQAGTDSSKTASFHIESLRAGIGPVLLGLA